MNWLQGHTRNRWVHNTSTFLALLCVFVLQSSELYSVLTKYREDHQIVLSQKDREIESLREQIKSNDKEKVQATAVT